MPLSDRRQPENAKLRAKIDHLQAVSLQLQASIDQVQTQTVVWARQHKLTDLPNAELANDLSVSFKSQRAALAQIQNDIQGVAKPQLPTQLLSDEELKALLK
jgi:hypothetical protein